MNLIDICAFSLIRSDLPATARNPWVLAEHFKAGEQDLCLPSPLWRPVSEAEASPASAQPLTPANTGTVMKRCDLCHVQHIFFHHTEAGKVEAVAVAVAADSAITGHHVHFISLANQLRIPRVFRAPPGNML